MFQLLGYLKEYNKESILGPIFKLLEALLEIMLPTIMALVINVGVAGRDVRYVLWMGALMFVMSVLGFCSSMVCQFYASRASQGFGTNLRNALFTHISAMSHRELDRWGASSLINRVTNDVNQLQNAVAMTIRLVVRAICIFLGSIVMAMLLDFRLSLILVATVPLIAAILYFFITRTSPLYKKYQKKLDALGVILGESLSGVRVIRAFAARRQEKKRFGDANDALTQTGFGIGLLSSLLNPMTQLVINGAIVILLWVGGYHANAGSLEAGTLIAFINYMTQIVYALTIASNLIVLMTKASTSAGRINEVLAMPLTITDPASPLGLPDSPGTVAFEDVSFRYEQDGEMALEHVTLTAARGETIGIIGGTGSGKSTLVQLIPRFYDASEGRVLVGGKDVRSYSLDALRAMIGVVPQKNELFSGTIAENLRWGNPNASERDLTEAARIAQADEFIRAGKGGYDGAVDAGGVNFSGGQKQRLAIARALVKRPDILILDDSFSALDFATDAALRKAIRETSRHTTVFIVSQRASTIRYADKIVALDDGQVAGIGTHQSLMESCEVYREICLSQMSDEEAAR